MQSVEGGKIRERDKGAKGFLRDNGQVGRKAFDLARRFTEGIREGHDFAVVEFTSPLTGAGRTQVNAIKASRRNEKNPGRAKDQQIDPADSADCRGENGT